MKNSITDKYFKQAKWTPAESVLLIIAVLGVIYATFFWGGGPIGVPVSVVSAFILVFLKSQKIKDSEVDSQINKLISTHIGDTGLKNIIKCFDLQSEPIRKGKDGKLRSSIYVVSFFKFDKEFAEITVYNLDLLSTTVSKNTYKISNETPVFLQEKTIQVSGNQKTVEYLVCKDVSLNIPVYTNEINASSIIEKLCRNEKN